MSKKFVLGRGVNPSSTNVLYRVSGDTVATIENGRLSFVEDVSNDLKLDILSTLEFWNIRVSI